MLKFEPCSLIYNTQFQGQHEHLNFNKKRAQPPEVKIYLKKEK